MSFIERELEIRAKQVDEFLIRHFDFYRNEQSFAPKVLLDSIEYSLTSGGKRFRPVLSLLVAEHFEQDLMQVMPFAAAIEMVHTYSLIHDDLPSMDNDDVRRGRPTNHKVYGEAIALLAGDSLLTEAFLVLTRYYGAQDPMLVVNLVEKLTEAAGISGMVAGQVLDMESSKVKADIEFLKRMHKLKTSQLIRLSLEGAALACRAPQTEVLALKFFGDALGLAFQIADDLLDMDKNEDGKSFVQFLGEEGTRSLLRQTSNKAKEYLNKLTKPNPLLLQIVEYNIQRKK